MLALLVLPAASLSADDGWEASWPLGFNDGLSYGPRKLFEGDRLLEDTGFGALNPDLPGGTCFGVLWRRVYHAGVDIYREDGESTRGAEVTAIADGIVVYDDPGMYFPGRVLIVEHEKDGEKLYSVYGHLSYNSIEVSRGEEVKRGQRLGTVMYQAYTGRFPEYHPSGDDSHLHFELRRFLSARSIYPAYPRCNGLVPGRGYTYPAPPTSFPAAGQGYLDPASILN